jgi:hypothetical protein
MPKSFCTECGESLESSWKHCPSCGTFAEKISVDISQDAPTSSENFDSSQIADSYEYQEGEIIPQINRRIAYLCAFRWALLTAAIIWIVCALFLPIKATYSKSSNNALGVPRTVEVSVSCRNGWNSIFMSKDINSPTKVERDACSNPSEMTWLVDGGLTALIWLVAVLGIGYLVNRNRLVRDDSIWFPYRQPEESRNHYN